MVKWLSQQTLNLHIPSSNLGEPTTLLEEETVVFYKKCICGAEITKINRNFCSQQCFHKSTRKIDWDSIDLIEILKTKSVLSLSRELGVSDNAIHKRLKNYKKHS